MGYCFYDRYVIHLPSVPPFFHHDGARLVPRITALDLLWLAMVGLVFFGVVARHLY